MSLCVIAFSLLLEEMQGPWVDREQKLKPQTVGAVPGEVALSQHGSIITAASSESPYFTPSAKPSSLGWLKGLPHFVLYCRTLSVPFHHLAEAVGESDRILADGPCEKHVIEQQPSHSQAASSCTLQATPRFMAQKSWTLQQDRLWWQYLTHPLQNLIKTNLYSKKFTIQANDNETNVWDRKLQSLPHTHHNKQTFLCRQSGSLWWCNWKCWWKFSHASQWDMQESYGNANVMFRIVVSIGWAFSGAPYEVLVIVNKTTLY